MAYSGLTFLAAQKRNTPDRIVSRLRQEMHMGGYPALRQALQSGELVAGPLSVAITMICFEINELVDLSQYWELEAQTVEK
jgi:hypothetical protein